MPKIEFPEPLSRFECNQKGCCCKVWTIPFQPSDLHRLIERMDDEELSETLRGARFDSLPSGRLKGFRLRVEQPDSRCQFLADDGRCGLQVRRGIDILPKICRAFPAGSVEIDGVRQLVWETVCPEVLERIAESDGPFEIVYRDVPEEHHLADRAGFGLILPELKLRDREIGTEGLEIIRRRLVEACNARERSLMATLSGLNWALWRAAGGEALDAFALRDDPIEPFESFFESCLWAHGSLVLAERTRQYERFVFALDLSEVKWSSFAPYLEHREDWRSVVDPDDPALSPLLFRYLAHRSYAPFGASYRTEQADLVFGAITHYVATAIRIAVGLISWLGLDDSRTALKVALGASEYFYRGLRDAPPAIVPWFDPDQD